MLLASPPGNTVPQAMATPNETELRMIAEVVSECAKYRSGTSFNTSVEGIARAALIDPRFRARIAAVHRRLEKGTTLVYLSFGWIALITPHPLFATLAASTIYLLAAGGTLYTIGVAFHLWEGLRFHNSIWHALVVIAAGFHYCAVLFGVTLASAG